VTWFNALVVVVGNVCEPSYPKPVVWLLASVRLARFPYASMVAVSMGLAPPFSHLEFPGQASAGRRRRARTGALVVIVDLGLLDLVRRRRTGRVGARVRRLQALRSQDPRGRIRSEDADDGPVIGCVARVPVAVLPIDVAIGIVMKPGMRLAAASPRAGAEGSEHVDGRVVEVRQAGVRSAISRLRIQYTLETVSPAMTRYCFPFMNAVATAGLFTPIATSFLDGNTWWSGSSLRQAREAPSWSWKRSPGSPSPRDGNIRGV